MPSAKGSEIRIFVPIYNCDPLEAVYDIPVPVKLSAKIICYESIDTRDSAFLITKEMTYLYALVMFRICLGFKFADLTSVF